MPLSPYHYHPVMCITQDNRALSHVEQARRFCLAGAKWVQLRMKGAEAGAWLSAARDFVAVCREAGAVSIVNDSVEVAVASGADGVHVGKLDLDWAEARRRLGPGRILGGTVNNAQDADRAAGAGCLDYVGVGPLRFTATKRNLAPVLGLAGIAALVERLQGLPAWAIGGVQPGDMSALRGAGLAGAAVSGGLLENDAIDRNFRAFQDAWSGREGPRVRLASSDRVSNRGT